MTMPSLSKPGSLKVVIVGGYGVFGALTAQLLARDGHQLWLAGRRPEAARALARRLGADLLKVDLHRSPEVLFDVNPDVVIDAAGPFQYYGDAPYKLPKLCIEKGCHYLDLSDGAEFTSGISALNAAAKSAGVFVLSGASSVPGLSSIIVQNLAEDLDETDLVDIAILPGNRAPRGMSVIKSIVSGVGRPSKVLRNGQWSTVYGWTDRKIYALEPGLKRAGYFVDVPDIHLLPQKISAKTVMFRAGLELGVMNTALVLLAKVRRWGRFDLPRPAYRALYWISQALYPFGTDRGGMQVTVTGRQSGKHVSRQWTLIAEDGDGPFVPGIVCRALLRQKDQIAHGARPCLAEVSRPTVENAMTDLSIRLFTQQI